MVKQKTSDKTLVISFSGGRTSGYLTKRLLEEKNKWKDVIVIFANTGQEHEKTLEFINNCDKKFGFNTVWIEAIAHPGERKTSTAKIVNYKTASRDGRPFEDVIAKYGIPWSKARHCIWTDTDCIRDKDKRKPYRLFPKSLQLLGRLPCIRRTNLSFRTRCFLYQETRL